MFNDASLPTHDPGSIPLSFVSPFFPSLPFLYFSTCRTLSLSHTLALAHAPSFLGLSAPPAKGAAYRHSMLVEGRLRAGERGTEHLANVVSSITLF